VHSPEAKDLCNVAESEQIACILHFVQDDRSLSKSDQKDDEFPRLSGRYANHAHHQAMLDVVLGYR
jgi:hypothetical protein